MITVLLGLWAVACHSAAVQPENIDVFDFEYGGKASHVQIEGHDYKIEAPQISFQQLSVKLVALFDRIRSDRLRITIQRIDSIRGDNDKSATWKGYEGWPVPLRLTFAGDREVGIPPNPQHDAMSLEVPAEPLQQQSLDKSDAIPRILHQTCEPDDLKLWYIQKPMQLMEELNPSWTMRRRDMAQMRQDMQTLEGERGLRAFDAIIPGAFKADLWRYTVMYHHGGAYLDHKLLVRFPLDLLLPPAPKSGTMAYERVGLGICNNFMVLPKGHLLMRLAIDACIKNIEARDYTDIALGVTGPYMLGRVFAGIGGRTAAAVRLMQFSKFGEYFVDARLSSPPVVGSPVYYLYRNTRGSQSYYARLWDRREIYASE